MTELSPAAQAALATYQKNKNGAPPPFTREGFDALRRDAGEDPLPAGDALAYYTKLLNQAGGEAAVKAVAGKRGLTRGPELVAAGTKRVDWLIDGLLPVSSVGMLVGRPGIGKSVLGRNLAHAIATGGTFLGRPCRTGKVIWVGLEESFGTLARHLVTLGLHEHADTFASHNGRDFEGGYLRWLENVAREEQPDLFVVDTVVALLELSNACDYTEVDRKTAPLLDLRNRYGCAWMLLHHANRFGSTHGQTVWDKVPDVVLNYYLAANADGEQRFLKTTKARDDNELTPTVIGYDRETGLVSVAGTSFELAVKRAEKTILSEGLSGSREYLADHCGASTKAGRQALDNLLASGLYVAEKSGRGTTYKSAEALLPLHGRSPSASLAKTIYKEPAEPAEGQPTLAEPADPADPAEPAEEDLLLKYADERIHE